MYNQSKFPNNRKLHCTIILDVSTNTFEWENSSALYYIRHGHHEKLFACIDFVPSGVIVARKWILCHHNHLLLHLGTIQPDGCCGWKVRLLGHLVAIVRGEKTEIEWKLDGSCCLVFIGVAGIVGWRIWYIRSGMD